MNVPGNCSYSHLAANATTSIVSGRAGLLHSVTINTKGASSNTLTLSDGAATIAVIDTTVAPVTLQYDIAFQSGLTAVMATGTPADVTIGFQ